MRKFLLYFILFSISHSLFSQTYSLDWRRELMIGGVATVSAATYGLTNEKLKPLTPLTISALNSDIIPDFDRSATTRLNVESGKLSDIGVLSCMGLPLILIADKKVQKEWQTIAVMYAEVLGLGATLPMLTKNTVHRIRPYVFNPDKDMASKMELDAQRSFFSSHTCLAFSSAAFLSTVYSTYHPKSKLKPFVWGGTMLAAGAVGYLRYDSGNHFPSDILVGAAVGTGIGYLIPLIHKNKKNDQLSIIPVATDKSLGMSLSYTF